ncbi:MAG: RDD family protein [Bacteroidetes bacterium]|jgi:uncharacterized RDD family membrane protein YckC|nr:RDD family protein [Bacteroidota bacterium]
MNTIEIRTTQNVVIEYELASLRERILAFLLDLLIFGMLYLVIVLLLLGPIIRSLSSGGSLLLTVVYQILPIGGFMAYHLVSEIVANGQTWGKRTMGVRVVRLDGKEPGLSDHLLRAVFLIVDFIFSAGVFAALLISSSLKNQRLGDMTANTTVIRLQQNLSFRLSDILNIASLDDYEPHYPQVTQLTEDDMLLIKQVITRYRNHHNPAHAQAVQELVARLQEVLGIQQVPGDKVEFLKTLIRDYIVITR